MKGGLHPRPGPRGWVAPPGAPSAARTACLMLRPTPLLSMQVALLRGQSQLGPVQPGSHTHWPMEQRPRSAERSREGRGEPLRTGSPGCPPARKGLREASLGSREVATPGRTISSSIAQNFLPSFPPSTFLSAARVTIPKHKLNCVAPLFKNH